MKGLWLQDDRLVFRDDLPEPDVRPGEVLLKVRSAGICGTDIEMRRGYAGFAGVPGHEFVAEVADGPDEWRGERVVADINIGCGQCAACRRGDHKHCPERQVLGIRRRDGAFAEYLSLPTTQLLRIPSRLTDSAAAVAEPLAAALQVAEQVDVESGHRVLIVGAGRLGQLVAQVLSTRSDHVDVLIRSDKRRNQFAGSGVRCVTRPEGDYDVAVECTGSPDGLNIAIAGVRPRGTIVQKSTIAATTDIAVSDLVVKEISLVGSRCGPMDQALEWLADARIDFSHLPFDFFDFEEFEAAFDSAASPDIYKVLFTSG